MKKTTYGCKRCIILAFKVLDDDKTVKLDESWMDWTGASEILPQLSPVYKIAGVSCYKGVNVIPDIFRYFVLSEVTTNLRQNDTYLMDCLQSFE